MWNELRLLTENIQKKITGEILTIIHCKMNQDTPIYQLKDCHNEVIRSYYYKPELQLDINLKKK